MSSRRSKRAAVPTPNTAPSLQHAVPVWAYILALGFLAFSWANSIRGVFLLDDLVHIAGNPGIRRLWPIWACVGDSGRPLVDISLAVNFAIGRLAPAGYHVANLFIHVATGLTLFGLIRRTLRTSRCAARSGRIADSIAFAVALLWLVHPLTTQAVTYVIQRGESMMALFYVLTLYCVVRGVQAPRQRLWFSLAVLACAAGFLCKAIMVTAPLVVLLYDRMFLADSWKEPLKRRWPLYCGLAATWGVLFALGMVQSLIRPETHGSGTVGFSVSTVTPMQYLLSQPGVLLHYLRLSLWPDKLVFDYLWPPVTSLSDALLPGAIIVALLLIGVVLYVRNKPLGFLLLAFLLILAPTSSFIPIADLCVEHRMYLPLVCVIAALVCLIHRVLSRWTPSNPQVLVVLVLVIAGALTVRTFARNRDYASEEAMWRSVVSARPENYRAYDHLGTTLMEQGNFAGAIEQFREALRIKPGMTVIENNLANACAQSGDLDEAISLFQGILEKDPKLPRTHLNLALALQMKGRIPEAVAHYDAGMTPDIGEAGTWRNYALALQQVDRLRDAEIALRRALELMPTDPEGHVLLGSLLERRQEIRGAMEAYRAALRIDPNNRNAQQRLARLSPANSGQ